MKAWMLVIILLPVSAQADIEVKVSQIKYGLGSYGTFYFKAYQAGYSRYWNGFGLSLLGGQSDKSKSQYMERFFTLSALRKFIIKGPYSLELGANYSEYEACSDSWGCNPDTGNGWTIGVIKRINSDFAVKIYLDDYYTKRHKVLGTERTTGYGIQISIAQ